MNRFVTQGIVLARTDFGEADRILTFLTPDHGKVRAIAKGVRKQKSKLAGGIELFSVSDLTFLIGRSEINTLMSSRLNKHYGNIVKDLERTNTAYEMIKLIDKITQDDNESGYFDVLHQALTSLNDSKISPQIITLWCQLRLLDLAGHSPDLQNGVDGAKLPQAKKYNFNFQHMCFVPVDAGRGSYNPQDIKFLRFALNASHPQNLARVTGAEKLAGAVQPLIQTLLQTHVRV